MNYYYEIWADAIDKANKTPSYRSEKDKYGVLLLGFTLAQLSNLCSLNFIVGIVFGHKTTIFIGIPDDPTLFLICTFIPLLLINYLLIFHKKKYIKLIEKKKINTGAKAFVKYVIVSYVVYFLILALGVAFG